MFIVTTLLICEITIIKGIVIRTSMNDYLDIKKIAELNNKLTIHLNEKNIKNAFIYTPHSPEVYWKQNNLRIAFCNEEPYSTDGNFEKGINIITSKVLEDWTDGNRTIKRIFDLNYFIRHALLSGKEITDDDLNQLKKDVSKNGKDYYNKYEEMDKSLYFNFRYSIPTDKSEEHKKYIQDSYNDDSFYSEYYKSFLAVVNPNIIILGSELAANLFIQIYPELQGKLKYCGEPVSHNGRMIVSMPHPGWRFYSDNDTLTVVNKIVKNRNLLK